MARIKLPVVPLIAVETFADSYLLAEPGLTLEAFLRANPAFALTPLVPEYAARLLSDFALDIKNPSAFIPSCVNVRLDGGAANGGAARIDPSTNGSGEHPAAKPAADMTPAHGAATKAFPQTVDDETAVTLAYHQEIKTAAGFLRAGLSVLIYCDKLVVSHLSRRIALVAQRSALEADRKLDAADDLMGGSRRRQQIDALRKLVDGMNDRQVLVMPHLDLLAGGGDSSLGNEAREVTEILFAADKALVLAFADRSLKIPDVLAGRFAVKMEISGVPPRVTFPDGDSALVGQALVTRSEADSFAGFDAEQLYKNVAGMNPIRLRQALAYAGREVASNGPVSFAELGKALRAFKVQTSAGFEVSDVGFDQIGGYEEVKAQLDQTLRLMAGSFKLPRPELRAELLPRGFIFYGPPGTGKTLFAKAIANRLNATIQVVSGPEVTDMYVGESERKIREIFTEARRNAPSVIVFDEFDSIATKRSGREDGGSRAGNAIVAQILTEMDGFRPEVPILVIGTTNRLDIIDEALLRPSRFKPIEISLPALSARRSIAGVHAKRFAIDVSDGLLDLVAQFTENFNGDEIRSIFRDACVGAHCENPPRPVDAERLGWLVGEVRAAKERLAAMQQGSRIRVPAQRATPVAGLYALVGGDPGGA